MNVVVRGMSLNFAALLSAAALVTACGGSPGAQSNAPSSGQSAVARGSTRNKPTAEQSDVIVLPGEQTQASNAQAALPGATGSGAFRIEVVKAVYGVSGMPTQGCAAVDEKTPARRFTLQLRVINDTGQDLAPAAWGAAAFVGAKRSILCFAVEGGQLPSLITGKAQDLGLLTFIAPDEAVTSFVISTLGGLSARVCFSEERVIACPAS